MHTRIAFVILGQTPRTDLPPEIVAHSPCAVDVDEIGHAVW